MSEENDTNYIYYRGKWYYSVSDEKVIIVCHMKKVL